MSSSFKKLFEVQVGSLVTIKGNSYEVVKNRITSLELKRGGIIYDSVALGVEKKVDALIQVVAEVKVSVKPDLTGDLKKQVAKANLQASLKAQLDGKPSNVVAQGFAELKEAEFIDGKARFQNEVTRAGLKKVQERVEEVKGYANDLAADFDELSDDVTDRLHYLKEDVAEVQEEVLSVGHSVERIDSDVNSLVYQANRALGSIENRVEKLEEKGRKEDMQNELQARLDAQLANKKEENKSTGGVNVKNVLGQFKGLFGKVEGQFGLAATGGIAMRKGISNEFVTYNKNNGQITDVSSFVLDFKVPAFRLPVEASNIKVGDIVLNNNDYGYVTQVVENGEYVKTVQPAKASQSTVIPVTNFMFGKPFYTVVTTIDAAGEGGFNPALLLAMGDGKKDDILPFLLMSGGLGGNGAAAGGIDPTMLMLLGDNTEELLPFLLMQQGGVAQEGFNPLMLLALSGDKGKGGSKKDSLLPLLAMSGGLGGGQQAGGINPMMLMALSGDGDIDPMTLMALTGGFGGNQGGLFGANPATSSVPAPATNEEDTK